MRFLLMIFLIPILAINVFADEVEYVPGQYSSNPSTSPVPSLVVQKKVPVFSGLYSGNDSSLILFVDGYSPRVISVYRDAAQAVGDVGVLSYAPTGWQYFSDSTATAYWEADRYSIYGSVEYRLSEVYLGGTGGNITDSFTGHFYDYYYVPQLRITPGKAVTSTSTKSGYVPTGFSPAYDFTKIKFNVTDGEYITFVIPDQSFSMEPTYVLKSGHDYFLNLDFGVSFSLDTISVFDSNISFSEVKQSFAPATSRTFKITPSEDLALPSLALRVKFTSTGSASYRTMIIQPSTDSGILSRLDRILDSDAGGSVVDSAAESFDNAASEMDSAESSINSSLDSAKTSYGVDSGVDSVSQVVESLNGKRIEENLGNIYSDRYTELIEYVVGIPLMIFLGGIAIGALR